MELTDAQPPPVAIEIVWQAPSECPDAEAVRASAERLLGRSLDAPGLEKVTARARVRRNALEHWELSLWLAAKGGISDETLAADECRALADAVALKVALAADPLAVVGSWEPAPRASPPGGTVSPGSRARIGFRPVVGGMAGALPEVRPGAGLFGSLDLSAFRLELGAQIGWNGEAHYPDLPDVGARFQLFAGVLRGCAVPAARGVRFPICLGLETGVMSGSGFGVPTGESSHRFWGAIIFGPALSLPLTGGVSLWLEADGTAGFLRPAFRMRNLDTLYRAPVVGAQGWLGVEIVLPR